MKHRQSDTHYTLIFQKDEPFIANLTGFCEAHDIKAAFFHGLGGALSADLGFYHLDKQEYEFHHLDQTLEIVSLHGNIAIKDNEPFVHAHGVFADPKQQTYGGHIKEFVVGGTCEVQMHVFNTTWRRMPDEDTGLSLIDFDLDG